MKIFPDALISALLGYAVVFFGLGLLLLVVVLLGRAMAPKQAVAPQVPDSAPETPPAPEARLAPGSVGEVKLYDVSDRDAAMLMAIVAYRLGKPLNQLRFKSIKEVK